MKEYFEDADGKKCRITRDNMTCEELLEPSAAYIQKGIDRTNAFKKTSLKEKIIALQSKLSILNDLPDVDFKQDEIGKVTVQLTTAKTEYEALK